MRRRRQARAMAARAMAARAIFHPATPSVTRLATRSEGAASSQPSCKTGIITAIPITAENESWKPASRIRCGLGTSRSNAATAREVGRSGVRLSSPAAKNSKNMTRARRVEMPIPVSCAYTIRIHVEIPALKATGSRTFFKSPNSPAPIRDRCSPEIARRWLIPAPWYSAFTSLSIPFFRPSTMADAVAPFFSPSSFRNNTSDS